MRTMPDERKLPERQRILPLLSGAGFAGNAMGGQISRILRRFQGSCGSSWTDNAGLIVAEAVKSIGNSFFHSTTKDSSISMSKQPVNNLFSGDLPHVIQGEGALGERSRSASGTHGRPELYDGHVHPTPECQALPTLYLIDSLFHRAQRVESADSRCSRKAGEFRYCRNLSPATFNWAAARSSGDSSSIAKRIASAARANRPYPRGCPFLRLLVSNGDISLVVGVSCPSML